MASVPDVNVPAEGVTADGASHPNSKSAGAFTCIDKKPLIVRACIAKKEAKRLEKEAKLAAKAAKGPAPTEKKTKADKTKKDNKNAEVNFVDTTPKGQKKGILFER
jgi:valyl-tRNA synthetase